MLLQFSYPILNSFHEEKIRKAILVDFPDVVIVFFPPFGIHVSSRPIENLDPFLICKIQTALKRIADAWQ